MSCIIAIPGLASTDDLAVRTRSGIGVVAINAQSVHEVPIDGPYPAQQPTCIEAGRAFLYARRVGQGPTQELFRVNRDGTSNHQLTVGADVVLPYAVSPDGTDVAYVSAATGQLHAVQVESGKSRQLTRGFENAPAKGIRLPAWSPDARRIIVSYRMNSTFGVRFVIVDVETGRTSPAVETTATTFLTWYPWSPDGKRVAIPGLAGMSILDVSDSPPRVEREVPGGTRDVQWSPDGRYIAFAKDRSDDCGIYVLDTTTWGTSEITPRAFPFRCFHNPTWSRDSLRLAFFGYSSHDDMNPSPWPPTVFDELFVADRGRWHPKRRTGDLEETNWSGASWCLRD